MMCDICGKKARVAKLEDYPSSDEVIVHDCCIWECEACEPIWLPLAEEERIEAILEYFKSKTRETVAIK